MSVDNFNIVFVSVRSPLHRQSCTQWCSQLFFGSFAEAVARREGIYPRVAAVFPARVLALAPAIARRKAAALCSARAGYGPCFVRDYPSFVINELQPMIQFSSIFK